MSSSRTTRKLDEDTRQVAQLNAIEGNLDWLDDVQNDDELEWGADPMRLAEQAEEAHGVNCFGKPTN